MPGLEAENVVVAANGAVWIAPEGTAPPVDLAAPAAAWVDVGYVSDDGVTFSLSRDTEDVMAWQSTEAIRRLVTAEPKELSFELLEFDPESLSLAFRGGSVSKTGVAPAEIATFTPPLPGESAVVAVLVDWQDGDANWRFSASRAEISGDVEFNLTRSDAVRLPLTLAILASGPPTWTILSDAASWVAGAALLAASNGGGNSTSSKSTATPTAT